MIQVFRCKNTEVINGEGLNIELLDNMQIRLNEGIFKFHEKTFNISSTIIDLGIEEYDRTIYIALIDDEINPIYVQEEEGKVEEGIEKLIFMISRIQVPASCNDLNQCDVLIWHYEDINEDEEVLDDEKLQRRKTSQTI